MDAYLIACGFSVAAAVVLVGAYVYLVRPWHLNWGATDDEAADRLPGDERVPRPKSVATRAVTIAAPPDRVWPYLVRLGRAAPAWQRPGAGDGVPPDPKPPRGPVAVLDPGRALVTGGALDTDRGGATARAFVLRDLGDGRTRLVVRLRGRWPDGWRGWAANRLFWEPAHFVMERRMLLTVKRLAETAGEPEPAVRG